MLEKWEAEKLRFEFNVDDGKIVIKASREGDNKNLVVLYPTQGLSIEGEACL